VCPYQVFPYELFYTLIKRETCAASYEIPLEDSWLIAAAEKNIPIVTPGWEDSTCGNMIVAAKMEGNIPYMPVKSGLDAMEMLVDWYKANHQHKVGFFQIGGGIAGDFPICAVPLLRQDLQEDVNLWAYFCQISDAPTSYGGYSGAPPNEKITWGKLDCDTPSFIIESDASIVFPLVSAYVLDH
jgi:deoxyhypusine synthase